MSPVELSVWCVCIAHPSPVQLDPQTCPQHPKQPCLIWGRSTCAFTRTQRPHICFIPGLDCVLLCVAATGAAGACLLQRRQHSESLGRLPRCITVCSRTSSTQDALCEVELWQSSKVHALTTLVPSLQGALLAAGCCALTPRQSSRRRGLCHTPTFARITTPIKVLFETVPSLHPSFPVPPLQGCSAGAAQPLATP